MYNGEFRQCLEVTVSSENHKLCLDTTNTIKKQCEAWWFNVEYKEFKSARKGPVNSRTLMIYQTAYAGDILIFKEAVRRICNHFEIYKNNISFVDRGSEPVNSLRQDN